MWQIGGLQDAKTKRWTKHDDLQRNIIFIELNNIIESKSIKSIKLNLFS